MCVWLNKNSFYWGLYVITLRLDKVIVIGISDRYFHGFNDRNLQGIVTGVGDVINDFVVWCLYVLLHIVLDID